MASRANNQYTYQQPYPKKKRCHRKRNGQFWVNTTAFLVVFVLLLLALTLCWKGVQYLWNGMENALGFLTPEDPVISIISTEPAETAMEKQEGFVDLDTIYAAADAKLDEIIRDNATVKQQVHDVYAWARTYLSYGGHSDRTDWIQTAYVMLTEGKGDCYGYWAVTKLLFERLEIPNIDVRKVKNSADDSDHFWSLVSFDGGDTWYHFDSTPRVGEGDDFCLVTDSFIDAYSASHKGSHNRDKSLYPETP